ncbi:MAG: L,D-transpeptidase [Chloroflexi bacterium]|nr:MAG: L,D-transpeptidase [Chloroflexota bacterium]
MNTSLSRREFLKLSSAALGGLILPAFSPPDPEWPGPSMLLRVATESVSVFDEPDIEAETVGYRFQDTLLNVYYEVDADTPVYNTKWYRVWGGFVHSAFVQPIQVRFSNKVPELEIEEGQLYLAELTVPISQPYLFDKWQGWRPYDAFKLYYGTTHWIADIIEGPDLQAWYKIEDELYAGFNYYVPAGELRIIPEDEWSPLSTDVPFEEKRVEVSLDDQVVTAFEGKEVVLQTSVSTGIYTGRSTNGFPTTTPKGHHNIYSKMPSKHMGTGGRASSDGRPLPGVPWTAFFAPGGYAFHGTYWHNNFGIPMSRGCVNMRNKDAKWLFRWLEPISEVTDVERTGYGTQVYVY